MPKDWPTQDPKHVCYPQIVNDCRPYDNHRCFTITHLDVSYCVPDSCQKNVDCPDVGHIAHGLISSEGCNKGACVYSEGIIIAK